MARACQAFPPKIRTRAMLDSRSRASIVGLFRGTEKNNTWHHAAARRYQPIRSLGGGIPISATGMHSNERTVGDRKRCSNCPPGSAAYRFAPNRDRATDDCQGPWSSRASRRTLCHASSNACSLNSHRSNPPDVAPRSVVEREVSSGLDSVGQFDTRSHRQSRSQCGHRRLSCVEMDSHRHALHHFREVAGAGFER